MCLLICRFTDSSRYDKPFRSVPFRTEHCAVSTECNLLSTCSQVARCLLSSANILAGSFYKLLFYWLVCFTFLSYLRHEMLEAEVGVWDITSWGMTVHCFNSITYIESIYIYISLRTVIHKTHTHTQHNTHSTTQHTQHNTTQHTQHTTHKVGYNRLHVSAC